MKEVMKLKSVVVSGSPVGRRRSQQDDESEAMRLVEGILGRKSFYFQQRTGKLDIRAIGRVDVDRVVKEVDIDTLQVHLENVVFADVTEDDLRLYSDACFLNLFHISQLLLEYLLNVQDTLATSLEALAAKHATIRLMVDEGRAELHRTSEQARALKREVRQKRATIARYEQLLALPPPPGSGAPSRNGMLGGKLHSCLTCGKMFVSDEFLQQHIVRNHAHWDGNWKTSNRESEEKKQTADCDDESSSFPSQLRLFVQTSSGKCLDMAVQSATTVAQLRGYINSAAGFAAASSSKRIVYRGVHLHDDQTLSDCRIPTESQLVLIDTEVSDAIGAQAKLQVAEPLVPQGEKEVESAALKQMSTLMALVRQQMEWTMRSEESRRGQGIGAAEALEIRMREMEASLPRRLEEFMEESVGGLKISLRKAVDDMQMLNARRSNAGRLLDDEEDTWKEESKENEQLAALSEELQRVSRDNVALLDELQKIKSSQPLTESTCTVHAPEETEAPKTTPVLRLEDGKVSGSEVSPKDRIEDKLSRSSSHDMVFPSNGERSAITIRVSRNDTCETLCAAIAAKLDIMEARVLLRDTERGEVIDPQTPSSEIYCLHQKGFIDLEVLQGTLLSNNMVDGLVEFYERNVPITARSSQKIIQSMAEIDLSAKRHALGCGGVLALRGEDAVQHAANQVETIRAELASTLTGKRVADIDMGKSISRTPLGGVGLGFKAGSANGDIPSEAIFGTGSGDEAEEGPGLAELRRVVKERQQTRPEGIERQMANVSQSMEKQLSQLLEEAEEELDHLEQDSIGSDTYSSKDNETNDVHEESNRRDSGSPSTRRTRQRDVGMATGFNEAVIQDKQGDWNKTLDTTISIPEGPEARADEHEANAALVGFT